MIFDTHCHLGYDEDRDPAELRRRAELAGVSTLLDVGIDLASSRRAQATAEKLENVHFTAGLHPNHTQQLAAEWDEIARLCRVRSCRAVGETGLDFYRDRTTPEQQELALEAHLQLALELGKPVVIHCREAFARTFEVLERHPGSRGVMHCFSGGVPEARRALDLGFYLSFAGPLTYPKAGELRQAAAFAPLDRILVETDAPFLPPQGNRGQRNEPAYIVQTVQKLAEVRGMPFEEIARRTAANGYQLFGIPLQEDRAARKRG